MPRRVLHCLSNLDPGGVEKRVLRQLPSLQAQGSLQHELVAFRGGKLAAGAQTELPASGVPLHLLNKGPAIDISFNRQFSNLAKQLKPDLVIAYNFVAAFWTRLILRDQLRGTVVHEGGIRNAGTWWGKTAELALGKWTRARIFNSTSTALVWRHVLHQPDSGFIVLNGVPTATNGPVGQANEHPFTLLSVGRLVPIKGVGIQLRALALLRQTVPAARLLVVGDGPEKDKLQRLAQDLNLKGAVQWLGYQENTDQFYQQSDVFLCTSYNETFSLTLCEAMSHGLACIAPQVGGPAEILRHQQDGMLIPCGEILPSELAEKLPRLVADPLSGQVGQPRGMNPDDLAQVLLELHSSPLLRQQLGSQARARVGDQFSLERYCSDLEQTYLAILRGGSQP